MLVLLLVALIIIIVTVCKYRAILPYYCPIGLAIKVFANDLGDLGSITGQVIPKMVLDAFLLNIQHYKVWIKGKVGQSRERSSVLPYTSAIKKGAFESPLTMVANFTL